MPMYPYFCESCKKSIEISQKITQNPVKTCPHCYSSDFHRSPAKRIGVNFLGSGFYATDYAKGK